MNNLVRRKFYDRGSAPPADEVNIDGFMANNGIPHLPAMHLRPSDVWKAYMDDLTDTADAGTGFQVGIGWGDPAWDTTPSEASDGTTALEDLLGLFNATWQFVVPDPAGAIIFLEQGTRWTLSPSQTPYLYCEADYAATVEPDATVREVGLYLNTDPSAPGYLEAADINTLGELVGVDRIFLQSRSEDTSGKVRFILRVGHG